MSESKVSKILIGCVTYDGHAKFIDEFLEHFSNLSSKADIVFAYNSFSEEYPDLLRSRGLNVIRDKPLEGDTRIGSIIRGRNRIREHFLQGYHDFLLFVDTDVMLPADAIEGLIECRSDVSSGIYLCNQEIKGKLQLIPTVYVPVGEGGSGRSGQARTVPIRDVIPKKIFDIMACGLGCALISRKVLEKIHFHRLEGSDSETDKEDVAFCLDVRKEGFSMKANSAVKCGHYIRIDGRDTLSLIKE